MRSFIVDNWSSVKIPKSYIMGDTNRMLAWCLDTLGNGQEVNDFKSLNEESMWYFQNWYGYYMFYFKREVDYMWFVLRWS